MRRQSSAPFTHPVSDAYNHPKCRGKKPRWKKSINLLAEEFGISRLKVRKILITTGDVNYSETKRIQQLLAAGKTKMKFAHS